jgi:hypothetical protein
MMGLTFGDSEEMIRKASTDTLKAALLTSDGIGEKKKAVALEALMGKTIECDMENMYSIFKAFRKLTKMRVEDPDRGGFRNYRKMVQTGECDGDFFDYGVGFLDFHVRVIYDGQSKVHRVRISLQTIDDGDYGGWSNGMAPEKAQEIVDRIATEFLEDLDKLPSKDELNENLRPYGMYIDHE